MVDVQAWMLIPFIVMLLVIAVAPLIPGGFWDKNRNKLIVTLVIAVPTAIILINAGMGENLKHQLLSDYVPFITLLLALYVVTGRIQIKGDITATPFINATVLVIGYLLASFMGTTGASMLLIRPLIEFNKKRTHRAHTFLFFIAMVANCGGVLTPLGDPPLFLLYLRGAPFTWFSSLAGPWLFTGFMLLLIYLAFEGRLYSKEPVEVRRENFHVEPIRIKGRSNIIYLVLVMLAVIYLNANKIPAMGKEDAPAAIKYLREIVLVAIAAASHFTTGKSVLKSNKFSWEPILEVAILFVGIFTTMTPALMFLSQHAPALGIDKPWQFFYSTGTLSAFLDNSPTAVAFYSVASGLDFTAFEGMPFVAGIPETLLRAISLGAVFFGSMTYIGNGPNFMIKAIAERDGVHMPSFFGYILKFSLAVLLPVYVLTQLIFL